MNRQQSNFWAKTSLQHNSRTTPRIHTIFPRPAVNFPDFRWPNQLSDFPG